MFNKREGRKLGEPEVRKLVSQTLQGMVQLLREDRLSNHPREQPLIFPRLMRKGGTVRWKFLYGSTHSRSQNGDHRGVQAKMGKFGEKIGQDKYANLGKARKEIGWFERKLSPPQTQGSQGKLKEGPSLSLAAPWATAQGQPGQMPLSLGSGCADRGMRYREVQ